MPLPTREVRPANSYHYIMRVLEEVRSADPSPTARRSARAWIRRSRNTSKRGGARPGENRRLSAQNISIMVASRTTGEVLGYVGSSAFYDEAHAGAIDYAQTPRSSGSILKPFLFARGLDSGLFTPASIVADLPFAVLSPQGEYRAANFDNAYLGPMLYRGALANSRNTPALRVLESIGMEDFYALARKLGLARDSKDASYYGYGLAIGGLYITLTDLVTAYGTLANDGRSFQLRWLKADTAAEDSGLSGAASRTGEQVFSPYAAREISLFLSDDLARLPSFPRLSVLEFAFPWPSRQEPARGTGTRGRWPTPPDTSWGCGWEIPATSP